MVSLICFLESREDKTSALQPGFVVVDKENIKSGYPFRYRN